MADRISLLGVLAATLLAGCGDASPDGASTAEAEKVISQRAGHTVTYEPVSLIRSEREILQPEGGAREEVWKCKSDRGVHCWATAYSAEGLYVSNPQVGELVLRCPEYSASPAATPEAEPASATDDTSAYTPEEDLAAIELGYRPSSDNSTLQQIAGILDNIEADCPANTRRQLADFTANTIQVLDDAGISATPTQVLVDVQQSSSLGAFRDCLDVFALYAQLRKG